MIKPLHAKVLDADEIQNGVIFETDNGSLEITLLYDEEGSVSIKYNFVAKVPTLKEEQRN